MVALGTSGINCYKVFEEDPKTWQDAKQYCEQTESGKLLSILDGFEQSYIRLLSYVNPLSNPWIGLIKNDTEQYYWSDNWIVDYLNWAPTENSFQNCAYFDSNSGSWITSNCDQKRAFICKISQETPPQM